MATERRIPTILTVFIISAILAVSYAQTRRCFQYTWLGPRWNNESTFLNATCDDATSLSSGVPCQLPLVVSYDGSWPDTNYIWTHHPDASCILSDSDVCATYTYYFNGIVENSTHLCTRAVDDLGSALTSGCYEEKQGSFVTRVCLCRSVPGGVPCNSSTMNLTIRLLLIFALALIVIVAM